MKLLTERNFLKISLGRYTFCFEVKVLEDMTLFLSLSNKSPDPAGCSVQADPRTNAVSFSVLSFAFRSEFPSKINKSIFPPFFFLGGGGGGGICVCVCVCERSIRIMKLHCSHNKLLK